MEAITNHREYLSAHYLAEVLPGSLKKGLLADWTAREKKGEATPPTAAARVAPGLLRHKI